MDDVYDKALDHLTAITAFFAGWSVALLVWLFETPPVFLFVLLSVLLGIVLMRSVPKMVALRRRLRRLKQGRDGERAVAECLDLVKHDGAWVVHDLRGWLAREPHMIQPRDVALLHSRLKLVARGGA